jgi:hypothetical protein
VKSGMAELEQALEVPVLGAHRACPARRGLERVVNIEQALLAPVAEGEVAAWKGLQHRWVLRAGCG